MRNTTDTNWDNIYNLLEDLENIYTDLAKHKWGKRDLEFGEIIQNINAVLDILWSVEDREKRAFIRNTIENL